MNKENWDDIRYFLAVTRAGSVADAAAELGVSHTTVSRRVQAFEKRLGVKLFDRLSSGWAVTPVGEDILLQAESMEEQADTIHRQLQATSQELSGLLRVTTETTFMHYFLMPAIKTFSEHYPSIKMQLIVSDDLLNLARREADIAFRATDNPPPYLVGQRIAHVAYAIYGTQTLYERCVKNRDSKGISALAFLGDGHTPPPWVRESFPHASVSYRFNYLVGLFEAAKQGLGIAQIPCALGDPEPLLRRIPAKFVDPGWGLWVLSHVDLRTTARIRIFRDFMLAELGKQKDLLEGRRGESRTGRKGKSLP